MADPGFSTALQQVAGAADIVGVVLERVAHRLGDDGERRKMHHGVHADARAARRQTSCRSPMSPTTSGVSADRLPEAARQIIQHDDGFAALAQLQHHVAADVARRRP